MKLYEFEAKRILNCYGILTPPGHVAANISEAKRAASLLKPPYVVKAQVLVAGRGKARGVLFADNAEQVEEAARKLFQKSIKGAFVKKLLVEERVSASKELYLGIAVDRVARKYAIVGSTSGGIDIEEASKKSRESIVKTLVEPQEAFTLWRARQIAKKLGYGSGQQAELANILMKLHRAGINHDAELIETNPLLETTDARFIAVDARLIIDDNALFRHPELEKLRFTERENTPSEIQAAKKGLVYVKLQGDIGVVGNGAGLVMATLDVIRYYKGRPADFLDLGGGAPIERIRAALEIVLSDPKVKVVLVNILGGLTKCDDVARAIVQTKTKSIFRKKFVVRLMGTNEDAGRKILEKSGIAFLESMEKAAKRAVAVAGG